METTLQQKKDTEIELLKMACRDLVKEKELVCGFLAKTNDVLFLKLAENKALRKENEVLRSLVFKAN